MFWAHSCPAGRRSQGPQLPAAAGPVSQWAPASPGTAALRALPVGRKQSLRSSLHSPRAAAVSDSSRVPELLYAQRFHWSCGSAGSSQGQAGGRCTSPSLPSKPFSKDGEHDTSSPPSLLPYNPDQTDPERFIWSTVGFLGCPVHGQELDLILVDPL